MAAMKNRPGAAKMSERMRKIAQIIWEGMALSARATAWREGQRWEPDERPACRDGPADHQ
jgi:hypothetical protein